MCVLQICSHFNYRKIHPHIPDFLLPLHCSQQVLNFKKKGQCPLHKHSAAELNDNTWNNLFLLLRQTWVEIHCLTRNLAARMSTTISSGRMVLQSPSGPARVASTLSLLPGGMLGGGICDYGIDKTTDMASAATVKQAQPISKFNFRATFTRW